MLSIVSTPIGNLGDVTLRAIETFKACSAIVCEDTRVTGGLLHQLHLPKKELISMHGYSDPKRSITSSRDSSRENIWSSSAMPEHREFPIRGTRWFHVRELKESSLR